VDQGYTSVKDVDALSMMVWAAMHGMVTLSSKCRLRVMQLNDEEEMMKRVNNLMVNALFSKG
jgi:hypothetical protein